MQRPLLRLLVAGAVLAGPLTLPASTQLLQRTQGAPPFPSDVQRGPAPAPAPGPSRERSAPPSPEPSGTIAPFRMDPRSGAAAGPGPRASASPAVQQAAPLRPILPLGPLRLTGESDSRSWTIELTAAEAQSATGLSIGYTNAVVVMPEVSRLRVIVNGEPVSNTPISSAAGVSRVTAPLRQGLLKAGENSLRFEVVQRHRVECSVTGTYELWTDLDPAVTGFVFPAAGRPPVGGLQELAAVGFDTTGTTTIHVVAPKGSRPEVRDRLFRAVQTIALRGRFPHPVVQVTENDPGVTGPGTLKVALAVASDLGLAMPTPPAEAATRPFAGFVTEGARGSTLVISGPAWADVDRAIALLGTYRARNADGGSTLPTSSWSAPDAPVVTGGRRIRLSEVGIPTTEFSGRRLAVRFSLNLPGDFYAGDYGEARLYLDAAIAPSVRPGSRIDIYVNERISATTPIGIGQNAFQQFPIRVAMKYFRPGLNTLVMEAILATASDETCAPGSTLPGASRLALFDSTSLEIPNFARIGRRPDLAEVAAAGFARGHDGQVQVAVARFDPSQYAAAATLVTRMAIDAGRVINVRSVTIADAPSGSTVFVAPAGQLPPEMLARVGLPQDLGRTWTAPAPAPAEGPAPASTVRSTPQTPDPQDATATGSSQDVRERWNETLSGSGGRLARTFDAIQRWFKDRLGSLSAARASRPIGGAYEPPSGASWLITEGTNPSGDGSWLVVTAPTEQALREGTNRITKPTLWTQIAGRATALQFEPERVTAQPADTFEFVTTEPLTPRNLRLIAANWLSTNVLPYALLVTLGCMGLGLATHFLVGQVGRRS